MIEMVAFVRAQLPFHRPEILTQLAPIPSADDHRCNSRLTQNVVQSDLCHGHRALFCDLLKLLDNLIGLRIVYCIREAYLRKIKAQ